MNHFVPMLYHMATKGAFLQFLGSYGEVYHADWNGTVSSFSCLTLLEDTVELSAPKLIYKHCQLIT